MVNDPHEVLIEIGKPLITHPSDFRLVMLAICGNGYKPEIIALSTALEPPSNQDIIQGLEGLSKTNPPSKQMELELAKLIEKLISRSKLDKRTAHRVITSWARALRVVLPPAREFSCTWEVEVEVHTSVSPNRWETIGSTPGILTIPPYHDIKVIPKNMDSECFPIWVQHLEAIKEIEFLDLSGQKIADDDIASLDRFSNLRWLNLSSTAITNKGLATVSRLKGIRCLCLNSCRWITDEGLKELTRMDDLEELEIARNTALSNKGLEFFKGIPHLTKLDLSETSIRDAALHAIEGMPFLKHLDISYTAITDSALASLYTFPRLEKLSLMGCRKISDLGLAHLQATGSLRYLDLSETTITDEGIDYISELGLTELRIWGCWGVSDQALLPFGDEIIVGR